MVPAEKLKNLQLFKEISVSAIERLAEQMIEKQFEPGDTILKEGETSGSLYLILEGSVEVQKKLDKTGGRSKVVARLEKEEFFGEMSFLENQPISASIVPLEKTTVYILPRKSIDELIKKDPGVAVDQVMTLMTGISTRLRRTTRELVTVFEVARLMGQDAPLKQNVEQVTSQLQTVFGESVSVGFYWWNLFNDEYDLMAAAGSKGSLLPQNVNNQASLKIQDKGVQLVSEINLVKEREGLFVYHSDSASIFDAGAKQLIETISAVLAPTLRTARIHQEEEARRRLDRAKQERINS